MNQMENFGLVKHSSIHILIRMSLIRTSIFSAQLVNDQICFKKHAVGLLVVDFVRNGVKDHVSTARLRNHRGASHTLARQLMTEATRDLFFQLLVRSDLWYGLLRHNALISDHIQGLYCCGSLINLRVALKTMMSGRGRSFSASIIRISIYII